MSDSEGRDFEHGVTGGVPTLGDSDVDPALTLQVERQASEPRREFSFSDIVERQGANRGLVEKLVAEVSSLVLELRQTERGVPEQDTSRAPIDQRLLQVEEAILSVQRAVSRETGATAMIEKSIGEDLGEFRNFLTTRLANLEQTSGEQLKLLEETVLGHTEQLVAAVTADHAADETRIEELSQEIRDVANVVEERLNLVGRLLSERIEENERALPQISQVQSRMESLGTILTAVVEELHLLRQQSGKEARERADGLLAETAEVKGRIEKLERGISTSLNEMTDQLMELTQRARGVDERNSRPTDSIFLGALIMLVLIQLFMTLYQVLFSSV